MRNAMLILKLSYLVKHVVVVSRHYNPVAGFRHLLFEGFLVLVAREIVSDQPTD